jgi:hypothetical protein
VTADAEKKIVERMPEHQPADNVGIYESEEQRARYVPFGQAPTVLGIFEDAKISIERQVGVVVMDEIRVASAGERERPKECPFVTPVQLPKRKSGHPRPQ